ncbi:hypothetical protein JMM51_20945 [Rhodovulum sulfidophilum]|nr:hypothetical protein [Rhodovulum sulfidophilum]
MDRSLYFPRKLVKRCFKELENARRVANRYDRTAENFLDFIVITSIRLGVRLLLTWPGIHYSQRNFRESVELNGLANGYSLRRVEPTILSAR